MSAEEEIVRKIRAAKKKLDRLISESDSLQLSEAGNLVVQLVAIGATDRDIQDRLNEL